jgi:hypothetical protein
VGRRGAHEERVVIDRAGGPPHAGADHVGEGSSSYVRCPTAIVA